MRTGRRQRGRVSSGGDCPADCACDSKHGTLSPPFAAPGTHGKMTARSFHWPSCGRWVRHAGPSRSSPAQGRSRHECMRDREHASMRRHTWSRRRSPALRLETPDACGGRRSRRSGEYGRRSPKSSPGSRARHGADSCRGPSSFDRNRAHFRRRGASREKNMNNIRMLRQLVVPAMLCGQLALVPLPAVGQSGAGADDPHAGRRACWPMSWWMQLHASTPELDQPVRVALQPLNPKKLRRLWTSARRQPTP